jgi:DNA repair protein RadA/Sms
MVRVAKGHTEFVCQACGSSSPRWLGKCPDCGGWNTLVEEEVAARPHAGVLSGKAPEVVRLIDVAAHEKERRVIGIGELDRVLGGGVVPGSVVLISLQMGHCLAAQGLKVLYVSGEESAQQTKLRALRLGADVSEGISIASTTDLETILAAVRKFAPDLLIIDSIQVIYSSTLSSSAGSVGQVRECAGILTQLAKRSGISVILIGHVTKEGTLAGPRVLEHIVDTVLYFEGERFSNYRVLRAFKNRFGATHEVGIFQMGASGLAEVKNPSEIFLSERPEGVSGSVVVPVLEGSRPILIEVQALVTRANFGVTRRKAQGFDPNRLSLLVAVLEKRLGLKLFDQDVFVNIVGGMRVDDPALDLGVCLAIASSFLDRAIPSSTVVLGEIGLAAEVRRITQIDLRVNEAAKLGFGRAFMPRSNSVSSAVSKGAPRIWGARFKSYGRYHRDARIHSLFISSSIGGGFVNMTLFFVRMLFLVFAVVVGYSVGDVNNLNVLLTGAVGLTFGILIIGLEAGMKGISVRGLSSAVFGLLLGLVIARFLTQALFALLPLDRSTKDVTAYLFTLTFCYVGMAIALRGRDEFNLIIPYVRFRRQDERADAVILDTSAIVDGRVVDIMKSSFVEARLVVPRFVLRELQFVGCHQAPAGASRP